MAASLSRRAACRIKTGALATQQSSVVAFHGIGYSLTLHDKYGARVFSYDSAHAVKPSKKFKFSGQRLLEEFFAEADHVIKESMQ